MSRTYRKQTFNRCALRHPKTFNEIKQLDSLRYEEESVSYHYHKPPTSWDDKVCSSWHQNDYHQ